MADTFTTVDAYIAAQPQAVQPRLNALRALIRETAPEASECISWGMPTYKLKRNLVHFAAHARHTGLYPGPEPIEHFATELEGYKTSKGAIQLPLDKPLDEDLVRRIVAYGASLQA